MVLSIFLKRWRHHYGLMILFQNVTICCHVKWIFHFIKNDSWFYLTINWYSIFIYLIYKILIFCYHIYKCSNDTYNHVSVPFLPFSFRPLAGNNSAFWYKPDIFITLIANFTFAFHVDQFQHKKEITFNPIGILRGIIKIAADRQNQLY